MTASPIQAQPATEPHPVPPAVQMVQLLAGFQVCQALTPPLFALTPLGQTLSQDSQASMRDLAIMWMETHHGPFGDLPHVVAEARPRLARFGMGDRLTMAAGDFFAAVPEGADTYLLSMILHDWSDDEALRLLAGIRAGAPAGA